MKTKIGSGLNFLNLFLLALIILTGWSSGTKANVNMLLRADSLDYVQYRGTVVELETRKSLGFATLTLEGTNLSTVANSDGEFLFKVPVGSKEGNVIISFLGHKNKIVKLSELKTDRNRIELELLSVTLSTVSVHPKDPDMLMRNILNKRSENYSQDQNKMIVFYRETIKKNKTYVSLSEAVLDVYKQPCLSARSDQIEISKARKNTDYTRLDTITFKL